LAPQKINRHAKTDNTAENFILFRIVLLLIQLITLTRKNDFSGSPPLFKPAGHCDAHFVRLSPPPSRFEVCPDKPEPKRSHAKALNLKNSFFAFLCAFAPLREHNSVTT
jgi:hypothetical protein